MSYLSGCEVSNQLNQVCLSSKSLKISSAGVPLETGLGNTEFYNFGAQIT